MNSTVKPIIFMCGSPHSLTSMSAKFLIDNGAVTPDIWDNPDFDLPYTRLENKDIQEYLLKKHKFGTKDLTEFFDSLPLDKTILIKAPLLIYYINDIQQYIKRPIRLVFVMRNPQDIILSSIEKSNRQDFIYYFERIIWHYNFLVDAKLPVHVLISERLMLKDKHSATELLNFCGMDGQFPDFSGIELKKIKARTPTYLKYRFANFFWKRLSKLFRVYNFDHQDKLK